jgi:mono/diheme cytochrome c family protein
MTFQAKYATVVIIAIVLVSTMMWVIKIETTEKMKIQAEIEAGPRGDIVFKNKCSTCHKFDTTTEGKMNLANLPDTFTGDSLRSFIQNPPAPMKAWDGTPEELDKLVQWILAGPGGKAEAGGTASKGGADNAAAKGGG